MLDVADLHHTHATEYEAAGESTTDHGRFFLGLAARLRDEAGR